MLKTTPFIFNEKKMADEAKSLKKYILLNYPLQLPKLNRSSPYNLLHSIKALLKTYDL